MNSTPYTSLNGQLLYLPTFFIRLNNQLKEISGHKKWHRGGVKKSVNFHAGLPGPGEMVLRMMRRESVSVIVIVVAQQGGKIKLLPVLVAEWFKWSGPIKFGGDDQR